MSSQIIIGEESDGYTVVFKGTHYRIDHHFDETTTNNLMNLLVATSPKDTEVKIEPWY